MTGLVILAAGASTRLGKPKQNLVYQKQTLLQHAIETALSSKCNPIAVVLGANADVISPTIQNLPVNIIYNKDWREGMASSIRVGINELQKARPAISSVILMLCDQPFVSVSLLNDLIEIKGEKGIVASAYNDTLGVPALFDAKYFEELSLLKGPEGAKTLLQKYADDVCFLSFPLGSVDIDTAEDFGNLK